MDDNRKYFMINLHESMGPCWTQPHNPWICNQTRYLLLYGAWHKQIVFWQLLSHITYFVTPFYHTCLQLGVTLLDAGCDRSSNFDISVGPYVRPPDKSVNEYYFSYFSTKTYVVGTQKNHLAETVLLSTQNTCLN